MTMVAVMRRFTSLQLRPSAGQLNALNAMALTLEDMAEGGSKPQVYLSSLDPGVGKTSTLIAFIKQIVASSDHGDVGVLVCLPRLDEIARLVEEAELKRQDFAVFTSDDAVNGMSSTPREAAQILFTTQQMLMRRGAGLSFERCEAFHYMGSPRAVRVWDETLEPGEVVTLSTDDLGSLLSILRRISSELADRIDTVREQLRQSAPEALLKMPELAEGPLLAALARTKDSTLNTRLERLLHLSGKTVRVLQGLGKQRIALDIRDALPKGLAPLLVLDASGRVRETYAQWETGRGGLVRLRSAPKHYGPLVIHVLDQGGGKDSWNRNSPQLAQEVASLIATKPQEQWLVIHHKEAVGFDPKAEVLRLLEGDRSRVHFLHWGAHQATNAFKDIPNVILAGTLFLPDSQHRGLAHASSGVPVAEDMDGDVVEDIRHGEQGHAILEGLCRASVRGSAGARCKPCNAYIIAKGAAIREALPLWFPGCQLKTWRPRHKPLKGQIATVVAHIEKRLADDPVSTILFSELMEVIAVRDKSNFNKRIRKHERFKAAITALGLEEVPHDGSPHMTALRRVFDADPDASYIVEP